MKTKRIGGTFAAEIDDLQLNEASLQRNRGDLHQAYLDHKVIVLRGQAITTEVFAFRVIEAAGLDKDKDMKRERLGVAESASALKDRKIDAFFWVGGLPTAAVSDLANSPGAKIRMIDIAHLVPAMTKKHGNIYIKDVIEKSVYKGMETDNQAATVTNLLVVHQNMDDKTAYNIVKAVFDHRDELIRVHKEAENIKLENQKTEASSIPWHPGAIKFFAEKGVKIN